jgi:hypothetical protein
MACLGKGILVGCLMFGLTGFCTPSYARFHHHRVLVNCVKFHIDGRASESLGPVTIPPTRVCTVRMSHGYPIPDPACTPGAINPSMTADVLRDPAFRTACVRNQDTSEKQKTLTYRWYRIPHPAHNSGRSQVCELDHLVSLELGGADTLDNIWPQCGPSYAYLRQRYFKQKDVVENYLAKMVKEGKISLGDAQRGIAKDWTQYFPAASKDCPSGRCK